MIRSRFARGPALVLVSALLVGAAAPARAQIVDVPTFTVATPAGGGIVAALDVATGLDNAMLFAWIEASAGSTSERPALARHVSPSGATLGPLIHLDGGGTSLEPHIAADTRGGFVTSWVNRDGYYMKLLARFLGADGAPTTGILAVDPTGAFYTGNAVAGLPSGAVLAWRSGPGVSAQVYDAGGAPAGPVIAVRTKALYSDPHVRVVGLADGGFLVGWFDLDGSWGRRYDAAGVPLGDAVLLASEFRSSDVAVSPDGGFAIVGARQDGTQALPAAIWARRFDAAGAPLGPAFVVELLEPEVLGSAQAAFDADGRLFVGWIRSGVGVHHPRVRLYAPDGTALGRAFDVTDDAGFNEYAMAVRPDGRLASGWRVSAELHANVIAPCVPPFHTGCGNGVVNAPCEQCDQGGANSDTTPNACRTTCQRATCGDGTVDTGEDCDDGNLRGCDGCDSTCTLEVGWACGDGILLATCNEECDDGPANSDTTPDACRTSCRLPACADGVLDAGEGCDDGNLTPCDGCSEMCVAEPGLTCGDGIPEVGCGEQCDDGNAVVGDGCLASCRLEVVPGGGQQSGDCRSVWSISNPSNLPRYDTHGFISRIQQCHDGDPGCDFDGATNGSCTFHLRVCANSSNVAGCYAGLRLKSWTLTSPSATKAAKSPALAAVRAAFDGVPGVIVGPTTVDRCTDMLDVVLPERTSAKGPRATKLTLKSRAETYGNESDGDKITLTCLP